MGLENDSWANWDPSSYKGYGQIGGFRGETGGEEGLKRRDYGISLKRNV